MTKLHPDFLFERVYDYIGKRVILHAFMDADKPLKTTPLSCIITALIKSERLIGFYALDAVEEERRAEYRTLYAHSVFAFEVIAEPERDDED